LLRCSTWLSVWGLVLIGLTACQDRDFTAPGIAQGFKGQLDWVRDAFGEKVTQLPNDQNFAFPAMPNDPRPLPRTLKQQNDLKGSLTADLTTAGKISGATQSGDATRYVTLDGAAPTAAPISVAPEQVALPDAVREINSHDPSRGTGWFLLGEVPFSEGSALLRDDSNEGLRRAAQLVAKQGSLRVQGFSGSDRLEVPDLGRHEANRLLADLRARKVAERLIALGAPASALLVGPAPEVVRASGEKVEIIVDY
jgi:outer membrane protein OmpA-like peptidoglycan-associated protein